MDYAVGLWDISVVKKVAQTLLTNSYLYHVMYTHQMGVCLLNRSPLEEGGPASCEGPCRASSSSGDQN